MHCELWIVDCGLWFVDALCFLENSWVMCKKIRVYAQFSFKPWGPSAKM